MPRVDVAVADDDEKQGPVARGHGERVLVVDDEQPLLAVTAEVLARLGYEPVRLFRKSGSACGVRSTAWALRRGDHR